MTDFGFDLNPVEMDDRPCRREVFKNGKAGTSENIELCKQELARNGPLKIGRFKGLGQGYGKSARKARRKRKGGDTQISHSSENVHSLGQTCGVGIYV